jgi:hypothetical protein
LDNVLNILNEAVNKICEISTTGKHNSIRTTAMRKTKQSIQLIEENTKSLSTSILKQSDELEERFSRLEKTIKEAIASTATRTYAQVTAPETNSVKEISVNGGDRPLLTSLQ